MHDRGRLFVFAQVPPFVVTRESWPITTAGSLWAQREKPMNASIWPMPAPSRRYEK